MRSTLLMISWVFRNVSDMSTVIDLTVELRCSLRDDESALHVTVLGITGRRHTQVPLPVIFSLRRKRFASPKPTFSNPECQKQQSTSISLSLSLSDSMHHVFLYWKVASTWSTQTSRSSQSSASLGVRVTFKLVTLLRPLWLWTVRGFSRMSRVSRDLALCTSSTSTSVWESGTLSNKYCFRSSIKYRKNSEVCQYSVRI